METKTYSSIAVLLLMCGMASAADCVRRRIVHTIRFKDCQPKRLLSFACSGACQSYARLSPTDPNEILRLCTCCQEIAKVKKRVAIFCPSRSDEIRPFRRMIIQVNFPIKCMCRPCSVLPTHLLPSETGFMDSATKRSFLPGFDKGISLNRTDFVETVTEEDNFKILHKDNVKLSV